MMNTFTKQLKRLNDMLSNFISYKLSSKTIRRFRKKQGDLADSLIPLEEKWFHSEQKFLKALQSTKNFEQLKDHQSYLLKKAKGYFRFDPYIPHKTTREWVEALLFAVIVAFIARSFLFAPFRIPTGSMLPTIQIGDHIFASMYSYGLRVPLTDIRFFDQPVERGDIVIFPFPKDPSLDYIKRAIALEGETLEIRNDRVFINNQPLDEPYAFLNPKRRAEIDAQEQFGLPIRNFGPITIPKGHIFVMGDNRYDSLDSRFWGYVELVKIKGQGKMIYWSKDPGTLLDQNFILALVDMFDPRLIRFGRIFAFLE